MAARALGIALDRLPAQFSAPEKVQLAALMKATTSVSNPWLAGRLQMGQLAIVSRYVRRFRLRGEAEKNAFRTALSRVKT